MLIKKFSCKNGKKLISNTAFTLAEVLITLAIIGVVAAITIPSLVQKYKDQAAVSHLKKVYSVLTQAWELATLEYGPVSEWNLVATSGQEDIIIDRLSKYIKFNKICKTTDPQTCFPNVTYLAIDDTPYSDWTEIEIMTRARAQMSDGTLFMVNIRPYAGNTPIQFYIDLNGKSKPNKLGDDFFYFFVWNDNKLRPGGWDPDPAKKQTNFINSCVKEAGHQCANWVIEKGNRDYLYCKDLSYDGKSKCD